MVDTYAEMWHIPQVVISILKKYTGEKEPTVKNLKDTRRMFANEFTKEEQKTMIKWIKKNPAELFDIE